MKELAGALAQRRAQHLYRQRLIIDGPQGPRLQCNDTSLLSFCSNDYLGLANHPDLVKALQQGAERSTGYMANLGVITTLADRHDGVYQDRLNHASLIDAARLSGARSAARMTHRSTTRMSP